MTLLRLFSNVVLRLLKLVELPSAASAANAAIDSVYNLSHDTVAEQLFFSCEMFYR